MHEKPLLIHLGDYGFGWHFFVDHPWAARGPKSGDEGHAHHCGPGGQTFDRHQSTTDDNGHYGFLPIPEWGFPFLVTLRKIADDRTVIRATAEVAQQP